MASSQGSGPGNATSAAPASAPATALQPSLNTAISTASDHKQQPPGQATSLHHASFQKTSSLGASSLGSVLPSVSDFSAPTQEILKRVSANANLGAGSPGWEAAREQVLRNMTTSSNMPTPPPPTTTRGRGRGRPPRLETQSHYSAAEGSIRLATPANSARSTPRGRPRGKGKGRGRGRGGKRKREDSDSDDDDDSDVSASYTPLPTHTKSGRTVQKPSQYNPAPEASPESSTKRRRGGRRGSEYSLCAKCLRGHSPASNMIVYCDGCNTPYHQWCHDPMIPKDVVEVAEKEWVCAGCQGTHETETVTMGDRVSGESLALEEQETYLSTLPSSTLVSLLLRATSLHPDLPIFAPNTHGLIQAQHIKRHGPAPPPPPPPAQSTAATTTTTTKDPSSAIEPPHQEEDPYPDHNPANNPDPPATYPKPGHGPLHLPQTLHNHHPTSNGNGTGNGNDNDNGADGSAAGIPWLIDDNFEVFSHLYHDPGAGAGAGAAPLVPTERHEAWLRGREGARSADRADEDDGGGAAAAAAAAAAANEGGGWADQ